MRFDLSHKWDWYRWFAWYPVRINAEYVWLEWVERKLVTAGMFYDLEWQYRHVK